MKIDKQKIMEKVNSVSSETKKVTTDFARIAKTTAKKVSSDISSKIENVEVKSIISEQDISKLLDGLYGNVLNGLGKASPPVDEFANDYLSKENDPKIAAKKMIKSQILKCTTSGFITGFGGLITLPITVPANLGSVLYVQMRMIACTAYMAGYDLKSDQVQTFVYACLAGVSVNEVVKQTGVKVGVKMATSAISKIPGKTLVKINQKVGFRFMTKFGSKGVLNLGKMVPGVGAVIGGGLDYAETKAIANRAYDWFFNGEFEGEKENDDVEIIEANVSQETSVDPYEEIRKFKALLDDGIISQEDFDKKKKELLGL